MARTKAMDDVISVYTEKKRKQGRPPKQAPIYTRRNFSFPVGLFERIKAAALEEEKTVSALIADVLRTWLDRRDARRAKGEAA
jgi:predicted ArsR family transcriptional regulator